MTVARASLDELLLDYEDFLRQRGLPIWEKDDQNAQAVRERHKNITDRSDQTDQSDFALYAYWLNNSNPAIVANAIISLTHQANYLLDRQIAGLERQFVHQGGYSEILATARIQEREKQVSGESLIASCPACGAHMVMRTARKGARVGSQFWGCCKYPQCKGTKQQ